LTVQDTSISQIREKQVDFQEELVDFDKEIKNLESRQFITHEATKRIMKEKLDYQH
jgi:FAD synthase